MSKINLMAKEMLTAIPRRSPRFLSRNTPEAFDPKTPKGKHEANRILHSGSSPLSPISKWKGSNNKSIKLGRDEVSRKSKGGNCLLVTTVELKRSVRLSKIKNREEEVKNGIESGGGRVSKRASKRVDDCSIISSKDGEKRTLRMRVKRDLVIKDSNLSKILKKKVGSASGKDELGVDLSKEVELGVDLSKEVEWKTEKRVTRSDSRRNEHENEKSNCDAKFLGDNACRGKEQIGEKRKLNQPKGRSDCAKGWTEEQERALQRAYFAAKPTPQFWKRVSKMVPGKSAQDCFDKIHSAHLTPLQAQPQSRAKKIAPSSLSFSASKLLNSPEPKSKRYRSSYLAQKTVRQLLQKQSNNAQDKVSDLFAIFEATADPSNGASQQPTSCCTPEKNKGGLSVQNMCHETSPAYRKSLSRLNMSSISYLASPPVLKQIKNKALHENYIDQLHRRETKRKAALSRAVKQVASQNNKPGVQAGKLNAFNVARNALYFGASDAINEFQQSQKNAGYNSDLSDDDHLGSSDDGED